VSPLRQNKIVKNNLSGWDGAISFTKEKIKKLEAAIEGFKAAKKRGDPWPGAQSVDHSQEHRSPASHAADSHHRAIHHQSLQLHFHRDLR
jgi:hypothetical protein